MVVFFMAFMGGLFCTQIGNPFNWYRVIRSFVVSMKTSSDSEENKSEWEVFKSSFKCKIKKPIAFWVVQIVFFIVGGIILWSWFFFGVPDRTFSQMVVMGWFIGILYLINWAVVGGTQYGEYNTWHYWVQHACFGLILFCVSIGLLIHGGIYASNNHVTAHTFVEAEVPVISVDVSSTLEKEVLIQGYTIKSPVYRNKTVIYPMSRSDEANVSIAGYVKLMDDGTPIIVRKDLHYTPYQSGSQNIKYVARNFLPTVRFYGNWSFQIDESGEVYFAHIYGNFASLRAGRVVEGVLLVNAETGECNTYHINEVPSYVIGISE